MMADMSGYTRTELDDFPKVESVETSTPSIGKLTSHAPSETAHTKAMA
jgi:hypothetical protein